MIMPHLSLRLNEIAFIKHPSQDLGPRQHVGNGKSVGEKAHGQAGLSSGSMGRAHEWASETTFKS